MALERVVLLCFRQVNRWSPNGSRGLPHVQVLGRLEESGSRNFRWRRMRQFVGGMRLVGRKRGRLCRGRLVSGERRDGKANWVVMGRVGN